MISLSCVVSTVPEAMALYLVVALGRSPLTGHRFYPPRKLHQLPSASVVPRVKAPCLLSFCVSIPLHGLSKVGTCTFLQSFRFLRTTCALVVALRFPFHETLWSFFFSFSVPLVNVLVGNGIHIHSKKLMSCIGNCANCHVFPESVPCRSYPFCDISCIS